MEIFLCVRQGAHVSLPSVLPNTLTFLGSCFYGNFFVQSTLSFSCSTLFVFFFMLSVMRSHGQVLAIVDFCDCRTGRLVFSIWSLKSIHIPFSNIYTPLAVTLSLLRCSNNFKLVFLKARPPKYIFAKLCCQKN